MTEHYIRNKVFVSRVATTRATDLNAGKCQGQRGPERSTKTPDATARWVGARVAKCGPFAAGEPRSAGV